MAARVNGEGLLLSDYEEELKRYQAGLTELGQNFDPVVAKEEVLKMLTDHVLLAQAAAKQGFVSDDAALQARYEELAAEAGGAETLTAWIKPEFLFRRKFPQGFGTGYGGCLDAQQNPCPKCRPLLTRCMRARSL